jgi:hypothetical protein
MKKILLIFLLVLPLLLGQTIVRDNPVSVAWDEVTPMGGDTISYEVFVAPVGDYQAAQSVGETDLLTMDVTIANEGDWVIGVRTVRSITSNGEILYSEINWSDVNGLATPDPFIVRHYAVPAAPSNLRRQ